MSYTIKSQPTTPNATYTSLVYNVSSSHADKPQFNYLMDVYVSGSSDRLARIRQFPNPSLEAVFDPSRVFNDNMDYVLNFYNSTQLTDNHVRKFSVEFGEEYGTSSSSSIAVSASIQTNVIEVFPGQINPNNGTSYNYLDSASAVILSDRPTNTVEYETVTERLSVYNGTGSPSNVTFTYTSPATSSVVPIPAGQFNLLSYPITAPNSGQVTVAFGSDSFVKTYEPICHYPVYNFCFINKYGMWENYSTNLPVRGNTSVGKENYNQSFVDYSGTGAYSVSRRGETNYNNDLNENLTISTNWLSKQEAEWLTQMIESDEVYVQVLPDAITFYPIVITNASYVQNTGRKDQKTFMYDITFRYANQRIGR